MPQKYARFVWILVFFITLLGIGLRLVFIKSPGVMNDVITISAWGKNIHEHGWTEGYRTGANYPPVNLAILGASVRMHDWLSGNTTLGHPSLNRAMKIPTILADIWVSLLIFAILRCFLRVENALFAAILYWVYPATWLLSSYWGQTDGIYVSLSFGSFVAAMFGFPFFAGVFLVFSILAKPQALFVAPVIGVMLLRRRAYVFPAFLAISVTLVLILAPFLVEGKMSDLSAIYFARDTRGLMPYLSYYTYNFWWLILPKMSATILDTRSVVGPVTFRTIGTLLTVGCYIPILWRLHAVIRSDADSRKVLMASLAAATLCSLIFFLFMTRMSPRYYFPFIVFAIPLLVLERSGRFHVSALLITFCMNLLVIMFAWGISFAHLGFYGLALSLVNVFVTADLVAVWWQSILNPEQSRITLSTSGGKI